MKDALAFLNQSQYEKVSGNPEEMAISFIATDLYSIKDLEKNLLKIDDIGEEIGHKFEIIVGAKENSSYDSLLFSDLERKIENLTIVRVRSTNQGMAKRIATNLSSGKYLVFFDSSFSYSIEFADIIASFIRSGEKAVLVSDLIVFPRELFVHTGGYRDLRYAEDIDLLARVYSTANVIAYPILGSSMLIRQGIPLFSEKPEVKSRLSVSRMNFGRAQRDQILACNYRPSDIIELNLAGTGSDIFLSFIARIAFFFARSSRVAPVVHEQNNFVLLMDKILESLVLKDYMRLDGINMKPMLTVPAEMRRYLSDVSAAWKSHDIDTLLSVQ
ncbi:MAG: hypothetical protein ACP5OC_03390 [Thermoplasmata archaeon]